MSIAAIVTRGMDATGIASIVQHGLSASAGLPQPPPGGFQYATTTSISPPVGEFSLQQNAVPAIAVGDVAIVSLTTSPSVYPVVVNGDGTIIIHSNGDRSRQQIQYQYFRLSTGKIDDPLTNAWIDELAPHWNTGVLLRNASINVAITAINLAASGFATSFTGDTLSFALASGALPPGIALSSAGMLTGTPTILGAYTFTISAIDSTGASMESPASTIFVTGTVPVTVAVPNLVGDDSTAATSALTAASLIVGAITSTNSDTVAIGLVLSQLPAAGTVVNTGTTVSYILSSGPAVPGSPTLLVPNVVGLTQEQAQSTLATAGLALGTAKSSYDN